MATPETLKISLPYGITNSVIYAHSSNGASTSTVSSTRATSPDSTLQLNNLNDKLGGGDYTIEGNKIQISVTASDGTRYRKEVTDFSGIINFGAEDTVTAFYNPEQVLSQTVAEEPEPIPEPEPTPTPSPSVPTIPPTGGNPSYIPNTAVSEEVLASFGTIFGGLILMLLGLSLWGGKSTNFKP